MHKYITFLGSLGSGKTTHAELLAGFLGQPIFSEKADSPFMKDMFLNKRNALLNQLHFLYRNRNEIIGNISTAKNNVLIFDYNIIQVDVFSEYLLNTKEYKEFLNHFKLIYNEIPIPDLIIYLHINTSLNISRIKMRNRNYEKIDTKFITFMNNKIHEHLIKLKSRTRVLELDASRDIINSLETRMEVLSIIYKELTLI